MKKKSNRWPWPNCWDPAHVCIDLQNFIKYRQDESCLLNQWTRWWCGHEKDFLLLLPVAKRHPWNHLSHLRHWETSRSQLCADSACPVSFYLLGIKTSPRRWSEVAWGAPGAVPWTVASHLNREVTSRAFCAFCPMVSEATTIPMQMWRGHISCTQGSGPHFLGPQARTSMQRHHRGAPA